MAAKLRCDEQEKQSQSILNMKEAKSLLKSESEERLKLDDPSKQVFKLHI